MKKKEFREPIVFTHQEVVEALLAYRRIQKGKWTLRIEFGLIAENGEFPDGAVLPCAIVPIVNIGLSETDKLSKLSIDASTVKLAKGGGRKR